MKNEITDRMPMCLIVAGRRYLVFRLRILLLFLFVSSLFIGALLVRLNEKRREEKFARRVFATGGTVCYNYEWAPGMSYANETAEPYGPRWLRLLLGDGFFSKVVLVQMPSAKNSDLLEISQLKGLQFLDLSHSVNFTNDGLAQLAGLNALEELYLFDTRTDDQGAAFLKSLHNLQLLVLDDTKITDKSLKHLRSLKRISFLSLDGTRITDAGIASLKEMESLRDLRLAYNSLTDAAFVHLRAMRNLVTLSLVGNNKITVSAINCLKEKLPNTEITWENEKGDTESVRSQIDDIPK